MIIKHTLISLTVLRIFGQNVFNVTDLNSSTHMGGQSASLLFRHTVLYVTIVIYTSTKL